MIMHSPKHLAGICRVLSNTCAHLNSSRPLAMLIVFRTLLCDEDALQTENNHRQICSNGPHSSPARSPSRRWQSRSGPRSSG